MADALRDVLLHDHSLSQHANSVALDYLVELAGQPSSSLELDEPKKLAAQSHSLLLSIQGLSKRSHGAVVASAVSHAALCRSLPGIATRAADLRNAVPRLEEEAATFLTSFDRSSGENARLEARKQALLLLRNVERSVDMMELPTLLASALSATPPNFSSALDIYSHTRRLQSIYPASPLVEGLSQQADNSMRDMAAELLVALKAPSLKLAASLRLVGWLRRILPDLELGLGGDYQSHQSREATLALMFLLSRLATLTRTLDALEPLRDLANHEKDRLAGATANSQSWSGGQHTERYLKRFIEIFREQSFGIMSMFRGVFSGPSDHPAGLGHAHTAPEEDDGLRSPPSPLASFPLHLSEMLIDTLQEYLPVVRDQASRDSILTQALYCAGSLGRLGGDFGMLLVDTQLPQDTAAARSEWVEVVKRHRALAGRLESIIGPAV